MLNEMRKRREDDDQGFTLIELMVVILIIAILIAIAIPTFLGAQKRAKDRAAQSDLRNALSAARTLATDFEGAFCASTCATTTDATLASALISEEGALDFSPGTNPASGSTIVAVDVDSYTNAAGDTIDNGQLFMTRRSKSGKMFGLLATSDGDVTYCQGSGTPLTAAGCADADW